MCVVYHGSRVGFHMRVCNRHFAVQESCLYSHERLFRTLAVSDTKSLKLESFFLAKLKTWWPGGKILRRLDTGSERLLETTLPMG